MIRLCCLKLGHTSLKPAETQEKTLSESWSANIKSAYNEVKTEKIENIQEINHNGKAIPLKSQRLRQVFKKVENQMADLQTEQGRSDINNFLKFVSTLDDACIVIRKEKAEEMKKSEQSGQVFNVLLQYCAKLKMRATLERNML